MPPLPQILTLTNVHFSRANRPILQNLSWTVTAGQVAAVVGPNGCGKSTLLRLIAGYLWPSEGAISLLGHRLGEHPLESLRARTGIVEATTLYPFDDTMTALQVVCSGYYSALTMGYARPSRDKWSHARHCLTQVALGDRADQLYSTLSTGQRMRCLIARALVRKPDLLLFDEPTAGLDLPAREAVLATLTRMHRTPPAPAIVIVTHHLGDLLPQTSNILLLAHDGRPIAAAPPRHVLTNRHLTAAYRCPIHVLCRHGRYHAHVNPQSWSDLLG